jgi:hypothetical protein
VPILFYVGTPLNEIKKLEFEILIRRDGLPKYFLIISWILSRLLHIVKDLNYQLIRDRCNFFFEFSSFHFSEPQPILRST